jgi:integrase/recombinase XerD
MRPWPLEGSEIIMAQGKQAKVLTEVQVKTVLLHLEHHGRYPDRDRVMVLLSLKAGLRAKEIAGLTWGMVTDVNGDLGEAIALPNSASKGKGGGRTIPLNGELRAALVALKDRAASGSCAGSAEPRGRDLVGPDLPVIHSERRSGYSAAAVAVWFHRLYSDLGFSGASSHSGRRTFITKAAKKIVEAGGSLRDVQELAGHASLATTQRYIQGDTEAKRKVVALI